MGLFDDLIPAGDGGPPAALRITVTPNDRPPIPPQGRALLDTIAGSESPGYNTLYGGGQFQGFEDHPRQAIPIQSGPNAGKTSSAAGRYQFLGSTWDEVKREAGLPDFSPDSQDQGAWHLAQKTYKTKTGRDLAGDLESAKGNPNAVAGIGRMLSGVWTSLPGGIEPNRATMSFASRYDGATQPTEFSSQSRRSTGLFDDLVPSGAGGVPPEVAAVTPPQADTGGRFSDNPGQNFRTAREGESPAFATKGEAFGKGLARGVTFNFIDELNALARAGGLDPNDADGINAAIGLLKGGYRLATGDPNAQATYRVEASKEREAADRTRDQQPGAMLAGELGGALATIPFSGGATAATLPGRITQGARVGAGYGALSGAGEGTDAQSRGMGALTGGATGAILGAGAPVAVEGVVQGARGLAAPFQQVGRAVRGALDPEAEAARRVTAALQRDASVAGGPPGVAPADFAASVQSGGPAAIMDLGGETTRALARSAANTSPEGRAVLNKTINDRFESQSDRVTGWLNQTFGRSDTGATREAIEEAARQANQPAYQKAFAQGRAGIWDQDLAELSRAPIMQDAIRAATRQAQNRSAPDVGKGTDLSARWLTDGKPTLEFWDLVKRQLDQEINVAKRAGRNEDVREVSRIKDLLVSQKLDDAVPSYAQARQGAARFFGADEALTAGEKFLTQNIPINDARRAFAQMSAPERDLFREGFVQSLTRKIEATGDRRSVLNSIAQSPRAREQMELAMGPQRAREFEAMMRVEGVMDLARGAVQGNSTTARQLTELGLAGGAYGIGTAGDITNPNPGALMTAALTYGALKGKGAIDRRVAQKVAEMLTSNDPGILRKGINLVGRNQNILNALRSFDAGVARSTAQQGPSLPAIQGAVKTAADEDQKN